MQNPILNSKKVLHVYITIWLGISASQIGVLYLFYAFPFFIAAIDTVVYNVIFAIMTLGLCYTIRYLSLENQSVFNLVINHLCTTVIIISLWLVMSSFLSNILLEGPDYDHYLSSTYPWKIGLGIMYYLATVLYFYLSIYYSSFKEKQLDEARLKSLVKETELNLLRSQMNPHFIFNSLNSISSLTIIEPYKAQEMLVKLSTYMRYALKQNEEPMITFERELDYTKLYLEIEKVRFGDKLNFNMLVDDETIGVKIPCMLLQPLLENAIKHGVYQSTDTVKVDLHASVTENTLTITLKNDYDASLPKRQGTGSGIKNTQERLYLIYQDQAYLKTTIDNNLFTVEVALPIV